MTFAELSLINVKTNCFYCDRLTYVNSPHANLRTRDHIIPTVRGGKNCPENRVWACTSCNNSKGPQLLNEWIPFLKEKAAHELKIHGAGFSYYTKVLQRAELLLNYQNANLNSLCRDLSVPSEVWKRLVSGV